MQPFSAADDPPLSSMSKETAVDMEEVRLKVEMCNSYVTCTLIRHYSKSKKVLLVKLKTLCMCTTAVLCDCYVAQFVDKFARKKHCQMFPALATVCCICIKGPLHVLLLIFILSLILFATLYSLNPMVPSLPKEGTEGDTGKKKTHHK